MDDGKNGNNVGGEMSIEAISDANSAQETTINHGVEGRVPADPNGSEAVVEPITALTEEKRIGNSGESPSPAIVEREEGTNDSDHIDGK